MNNFEGYDVDPGMVRIAQVNMYLHHFKNPKIYSYNTLTDDERWKDNFDVILANPPFMSPKGGVPRHNKFGIPSNRSEVLFVDYFITHLRPKGRAGMIVPEGIIFQSATAHTALRKKLVEDGLYAVVSLPSGVFQPYSGVKTSILFFDNERSSQNAEILFIKVENDGFDLGAQRKKIDKNDLPQALEILKKWKINGKIESPMAVYVARNIISQSEDYSLSIGRYLQTIDYANVKWLMVEMSDVCVIDWGNTELTKSVYKENAQYLAVSATGGDGRIDHYEHEVGVSVLSAIGANCGKMFYPEERFTAIKNTITFTPDIKKVIPKFLFYILSENQFPVRGGGQPFITKGDVQKYKVPVPPLEIQQQIVTELDGYQNIISGARQVVENWKPKIDIDPEWKKVRLPEIAEYFIGLTYSPEDVSAKGTIVLRSSNIQDGMLDFSNIVRVKKEIKENLMVRDGDILMCSRNGSKRLVGKIAVIKNLTERMTFGTFMTIIRSKYNQFLSYFFVSDLFRDQLDGSETASINQITKHMLDAIVVPLPSFEIQNKIVEKIEAERALVESSKKLIEIYEQKTRDVIAMLWGE